jgi:hypothetical protein
VELDAGHGRRVEGIDAFRIRRLDAGDIPPLWGLETELPQSQGGGVGDLISTTVRPSGATTVSCTSPSSPPFASNTTSTSLSVAFCSKKTLAMAKGSAGAYRSPAATNTKPEAPNASVTPASS